MYQHKFKGEVLLAGAAKQKGKNVFLGRIFKSRKKVKFQGKMTKVETIKKKRFKK